jgi:hypothetical protein
MSDISYIFPQHCCVCMGTPETNERVTASKQSGATVMNATVVVPICKSCQEKHFQRMGKRIGIVMIVFAVPGLLIGLMLGGESDIGTIGGGVVGLFASGFLAALIASMMQKQLPVKIKLEWQQDPRLEFENKEYQNLFNKANAFRINFPHV